MKFIKPANNELTGSWMISKNENYDINILYAKENCQGYLLHMNAYEKLVYLAGYNNVEKVENKEAPFSIIEDAISKKYGKDKTAEFFTTMNDWYMEYNNDYKGEEVYNLAIKLENLFLKFIETDIKNLKTEKEIKRYTEIYEFYKGKNIPQVKKTLVGEDIKEEVFGINNIDDLLYSRLEENIR